MSDCIVTAELAESARRALPVLRTRLESHEQADMHGHEACNLRRIIARCESMIEVYEANQ